MKAIPKISVVMPVYNEQEHVSAAIESILNQTFHDFELIIVDDSSTDNTPKILERYSKSDNRIRVIRNKENLYIAKALNKGVSIAKADIIARMDGDDISLNTRLKKQYDLILSNDNIAVVGANIELMDEEGKKMSIREYSTDPKKLKSSIFRYSPFAHPVTMFRKDYVQEIGGYNPEFSPTEDLDLWVKLGAKYEFASVPEVLMRYRFYPDSSSNKKLRSVELKVLKIRINAIRKYKYRPSLYDILYNISEFMTIWIPVRLRVKIFNYLRSKNLL